MAGYSKRKGCGCEPFKRTMNEWGWLGCIRHGKEIVAWLVEQARREGVVLKSDDLAGLVRRWVRDIIQEWRRSSSKANPRGKAS